MAMELRKTGISVVGDAPWGTHFCQFYETKEDLLDTLVPYFKAGLENNEFCVWVLSEPLTKEEVKEALRQALPRFDQYMAEGGMEILGAREWYLKDGIFDMQSVTSGWNTKLGQALVKGYDGIRVSGNTAWLEKTQWADFREYERQINESITGKPMTALCTYSLAASGAAEILDVARNHQFALAKRHGQWEVLETSELKQAKAEIARLNDELEQRVTERTIELRVANEHLRKEIIERKRAEALLHAQEQVFRAIVENAPDHIARYDREFQRTYANPALAKSYDLPAEALIGKPMFSIIRDAGLDVKEDELAQIRQRFAGVFDTAKSSEFEITLPMPRGRTDYSVRLFPELDLNGSVINVLSIARDITKRKQAEDALRRSEDNLRLVIDAIPTMAWSLGSDDVLDFVNQRWLDYTGLSFEEAIEEPTRTVHPEDLSRVLEKWLLVKATSEAYEDEMRLQRADGEYRWFLVRIAPLLDEQGNLLKRYGVAIDIEERKQAEERLKQSESQLAQGQRLAHVGSWDWDLRSDALTWSDELYRIFGLQPGKIKIAGDAMSFIHPEDRDLVLSAVKGSLKNKEPYSFYYRVLRPDGDERIVHSRGYIVIDDRGEPIRVFGATQDVTEHKQAGDELIRQKEILQQIFDHIPVMINFMDADGRIKLVNREWERTLGWSLEEIRQQNLDIFAKCYPDLQYRQEVLNFITEAKGQWADFKTRVRDGRVMDTTFVRVLLSDGTSIGIGNDITERKRAEEARRQAEQKYRDIFENAGEGIFQSTPEGRYIAANPALARMYRFASPEELIHSRQDISLQLYVDPTRREEFKRQLEEQGAVRGFEHEVFRKDGSRLWISVNARAVRDEQGAIQYYEGTAQDINERKAAEEKLKATGEQLRALSARLQSAREEEGTRIAREIHDELGAALTSLRWDLEIIGKHFSKSGKQSQVPALQKKIATMLGLIDTTINLIRRIASDLRPSVLDDFGLVVAIKWQVRQFKARTGMVIHCDCPLDSLDMNQEQSTALFRIFQEALTNIVRHAKATRVDVTMVEEAGAFILTIRDNGRGITADEKSAQLSLGLVGMRERAHLIGAEIDITGVEGEGTAVTVRLPIVPAGRTL